MRTSDSNNFEKNFLVSLKDSKWLEKQRIAGKVAAKSLKMLLDLVKDKSQLTLLEMNEIVEDFILSQNCQPTFKGYKGFPAGCCMSVNNQLVHGIPSNYRLQEGDLISFDLGATFEGVIADTAMTCIYGEPKLKDHVRLIDATQECLDKAIKSIKIGLRLGVIGHTINKCAKNHGFNIINEYGGHGIDISPEGVGIPHAPPFVENKSSLDVGIRIQEGLNIAIEPLLCIGSPTTKLLNDGWTVITPGINCHMEHTIFVHKDHVEILTSRENL